MMNLRQHLTRLLIANRHGLLLAFVFVTALLTGRPVYALGTAAGTDINNTATVNYNIGATNLSVTSNTATTRIAELIDVNVTWQDAASVNVSPGDSNQVLTYLLTNTGNGTDSYTLSVNNGLGGDQFNPALVDIYLDANGNNLYDAGIDTQYNVGVNDPPLAADSSLAVFVLNNIPGGLNNGDVGNSQLIATSNTGSGAPGTIISGAGEGGTDAVVGNSSGTDNDTGSYIVANITVSLVKSVSISDPLGGNQPMPGAIMTYTIEVTASGFGTASAVVITDPIPTDTTYSVNSLTLNAAPLTDVVDADAGDVGGTTANTVTVNLGDLNSTSPVQTITFDVIIN
jgi:uncharacterized repeat protein (TIGR01451 family)